MKKLIPFILYILLFNPFGLFSPVYKFAGNLFTNYLLTHYGKATKAIIIDEINYKKTSSQPFKFTYSYLFQVDGKKYKNDSEDSTLKVGDSVQIEYFKSKPSINKILLPKNNKASNSD